MKNDVVDNSERDAWALWREQGTDHALFDRSEKPLDDLAMMCSAAVGESEVRKGGGCTRKDVPSQVPGTKVAPQKKKRKGRRGQCNALQCKCNATQTEGGRKKKKNNWQNTMQGGRADIGLGKIPIVLLPQRCCKVLQRRMRQAGEEAEMRREWDSMRSIVSPRCRSRFTSLVHYPPYRVGCF